jgi:predicted nucleic acid-binding protein
MSFVLGASATLAWLYPEEITDAITEVFGQMADDCAWVPGLWRIEVANSLSLSLRRGRISRLRRDESLADLRTLPIFCDQETYDRAWGPSVELADRHHLTIYDATYLELAVRRSLPLATLDKDLRGAAERERVELLGM